MTTGVGGSTAEKELAGMSSMRGDVPPIGVEERLKRIARAQAIMREKGIDALYSIVQMPPGMPVATVAVGGWGARNAAVLAVEILSLSHDDVRAKYDEYRASLSR